MTGMLTALIILIVSLLIVIFCGIFWWGYGQDFIYNKCTCPEDKDDAKWYGTRKSNPIAAGFSFILPFLMTWTAAIYMYTKKSGASLDYGYNYAYADDYYDY